MRYLCLTYYDEKALDALSPEEYQALVGEAAACDDELRRSGHLVAAEALERAASAATIRTWKGNVATAAGPAAETKERLGELRVIEARDLNEAIQVAARIPAGRLGCIEVRPVRETARG